MLTFSAAVGTGTEIEIAGRRYTLKPLRIRDLGAIDEAMKQCILTVARKEAQAVTPDNSSGDAQVAASLLRKQIIDAAFDKVADVGLDTLWVNGLRTTPQVLLMTFGLALRDSGMTQDQIAALWESLSGEARGAILEEINLATYGRPKTPEPGSEPSAEGQAGNA